MATMEEMLDQYQRERVTMSSPEALTIMLYDAALKNIRDMQEHLELKPIEILARSQLARDILIGLADNVNMDHPYGKTMRDLYLYCWRTVIAAPGQANAAEQLTAVEAVLENLIRGLKAFINGQTRPVAGSATVPETMSIDFAG